MPKRFLIFFIFISFLNGNILQEAINKAKPGDIINLSKGVYKGNILINKELRIIGKSDNVIIEGLNKDSVITITSSNVSLENLIITKSGKRLDNLDSAIKIKKANNIKIRNCTIKESLFGIDMYMVNNSEIIQNSISSKKFNLSLRGDAIRLFYSNNNLIKNNIINNSRDLNLAYSNNNIIKNNTINNSRFAIHIEKSHYNIIDKNSFKENAVGILFAGAKNTKITNNSIQNGKGAAAIGVLVKGVSDFRFYNNIVSFNQKAFYIDAKHNEIGIKRFINNNEISYNKEAFHFHGAIKQNKITNNVIVGNIEDIVKSVRGNKTSQNIIENNYWDQYAGFDTNGDNIGDRPYQMRQYAHRLWHYNKNVKFFYASPIISILNFVLSVAPFIEPIILLEDTKPIVDLKRM